MFTLVGKVVSVNVDKTANGKQVTKVQILSNGWKFAQLYNINDYDNRSYEVGKNLNIPVSVKAYVSKNGGSGLSITAQSQKQT